MLGFLFFVFNEVLKIKFCVPGFSEFDLSGTKVCKFGGQTMRMRNVCEKVPTLENLNEKFLLVKQSQHTGELAMRD